MAAETEIGARLMADGVAADLAKRLARYGALLLEATRRVNLTAARTVDALVPHLLDALTLAPFVRGALVDVGAGGGLPGIPLALATAQRLTCVEAVAKKADFLGSALTHLGLEGTVRTGRAETLAHDPALRGTFLTATARAVGSASTVAELTLPFLAPGGVALLQRGAMDERERAAVAGAAEMLGGTLIEERQLAGERRIVIIEKRGETPGRFPRRTGIPTKRPLCYD
ncbi:MAG TPA: 16S rRNA (guanine(527)-N(7))-methyltransferase RsmG [Candidatus Binatia bacterium]|nr:16S rRNA (guanine(527)-N(7))-methyltransferase RsmG [Candidatus Binatia bacterium]